MPGTSFFDKIAPALGLSTRPKSKRHAKLMLASHFIRDADLFIDRYEYLIETDGRHHQSFRAKAIVDLVMSVECSLKSIVISLSKDKEEPEDAYKVARKCSHDLQKLWNECAGRGKRRFALGKCPDSIFKDLQSLGIASRYSLDLWLMRHRSDRQDRFCARDLVSRTIDDPHWAHELKVTAYKMLKLARKCDRRFLRPHSRVTQRGSKAVEKLVSKF